ncbi:hypothetical protein [Motiliproteus sediminis]|uniref:hypothetical protein n=1 Tax=Motiliproteus sediminis TaxID=1468178 RepID=UPI001AEF943F|nr:hypothetical protein [Motiliproteus sediminis]
MPTDTLDTGASRPHPEASTVPSGCGRQQPARLSNLTRAITEQINRTSHKTANGQVAALTKRLRQ